MLVATLAVGLNENSRTMRKLTGNTLSVEQMFLAMIIDNLQFLVWSKTKDAEKGRNKPESLYKRLVGIEDKKRDELVSFKTIEEFEIYMTQIRGGYFNE